MIAMTKGYEEAMKFTRNLYVRKYGYYAWTLDSLHYLIYDTRFYLNIAYKTLKNPFASEFDVTDTTTVLLKLAIKLNNLKHEKMKYKKLLREYEYKLLDWLKTFVQLLKKSKNIKIFFDFDGTLVSLPIKWIQVKRIIKQYVDINEWETITSVLNKLWTKDKEKYYLISKIIEESEMRVINDAKVIVNTELLNKLYGKVKYMYIVSRQSENTIKQVLRNYHLSHYFNKVYAREEGPDKMKIIAKEREQNASIVIIDDNLSTVVKAYRYGYIGLYITRSKHKTLQSYSLGIPSFVNVNEAISFLLTLLG